MKHPTYFDTIESESFFVAVNTASDLRTFIKGVLTSPVVRELACESVDEPGQIAVLKRVLELSVLSSDPRYENPHDTALATYLLVLMSRSRDLARIGAQVAFGLARCWWSRKIAAEILSDSGRLSRQTATSSQVLQASAVSTRLRSESPEVMVQVVPLRTDIEIGTFRVRTENVHRSDVAYRPTFAEPGPVPRLANLLVRTRSEACDQGFSLSRAA